MAFDYFDDGVRDVGHTGEVEISGNETIGKWREFILGSGEMAKTERSEDFDQAYTLFLKLIEWLREKGYIRFSKELSRKAEYYVVITKFPMEIRTRVKSTSASENLHKDLEKIQENGDGRSQDSKVCFRSSIGYFGRFTSLRRCFEMTHTKILTSAWLLVILLVMKDFV